MQYVSRLLLDGTCRSLWISGYGVPLQNLGRPDDPYVLTTMALGTLDARGTTVYVSRDLPRAPSQAGGRVELNTWLDWTEGGTWYEIGGNDLTLADLVRVMQSLEPIR